MKINRYTKKLQVWVNDDLLEKLVDYCQEKNITISDLVRRLIEKAVGYEVE